MAGVAQEYHVLVMVNPSWIRGNYYFCVNINLGEEMVRQLPPWISASYMTMDSIQCCRMQRTHIQHSKENGFSKIMCFKDTYAYIFFLIYMILKFIIDNLTAPMV